MRITLNLASRPYADLGPAMKRLRIGGAILAVLCLLLLLGLHHMHSKAEQARAREHSLDGQLAQINAERQGYLTMMKQPDNAQLLSQTTALNQLFDEKAFSWTLAMESLETVLPGGVSATTLEPQREKTGEIILRLRVVGPRDLGVELVRNLEHSRRFIHPRIVGENAEASGTGSMQKLEPVSASNRFDFDLLAEYNPPASDEFKHAKNTATVPPSQSGSPTRMPQLPVTAQGAQQKPNPAVAAHPAQGGRR